MINRIFVVTALAGVVLASMMTGCSELLRMPIDCIPPMSAR